MRKVLTDEHKQYIDDNYLKLSAKDISIKLDGISKGTIRSYLRQKGITIPKDVNLKFRSKGVAERYAKAEHPHDSIIREKYLTYPIKTLAKELGRSHCYVRGRLKALNLVIPEEITLARKKQNLYGPGNCPRNKGKKWTEFMSPEGMARSRTTTFKKGQLPHNTKYDGAQRITKDGYIEVRIALGKWVLLHRHNWEKVNGPVPYNHIITCKDGNKQNCDPTNWVLMSRADNAKRNSIHNLPEELKEVIMLTGRVKRKIKSLKDGK